MAITIRALISCCCIGASATLLYALFWESGQCKLHQLHQHVETKVQQRLHFECSTYSNSTCPSYFQWIQRDLSPWRSTGVTRGSIQRASSLADYKVIIIDGHLYTEHYRRCNLNQENENRYLFTLWSLLLLLEKYPGKVPDVEMAFNCEDYPLVWKLPFIDDSTSTAPAAIFSYCSDLDHYDIPFPDYSFWGWPQVNIGPWEESGAEIFKQKSKWLDRAPVAYWKGAKTTSRARRDLFKCNVSKTQLLVEHQDWQQEISNGFRNSRLSDQCKYRFKIYAQGRSWSASLKYILACGSTVLYIQSKYYDFYSRGLIAFVHYWPIEHSSKLRWWTTEGDKSLLCDSIKSGVDWGNKNPSKAEEIGKCGRAFLMRDVQMNLVYDYMFHLVQAYASLMKFQPKTSVNLKLRTIDNVMAIAPPAYKAMLQRTLHEAVISSHSPPCTLP